MNKMVPPTRVDIKAILRDSTLRRALLDRATAAIIVIVRWGDSQTERLADQPAIPVQTGAKMECKPEP